MWLMEGLRARGHEVGFLGSCPALLQRTEELRMKNYELRIGPPPVTKWGAVSFLWRRKAMQKQLIESLNKLIANCYSLPAIFMLSLSEKLLLTDWAVENDMKVFWIEHDRIGPWLQWNPWLPALKRASRKATVVCVSQLSKKLYEGLGFDSKRIVVIPNGMPTSPPSSPSPFSRGEKGDDGTRWFGKKPANSTILKFAKEMRKTPTSAEELLWNHLRDRQLGEKFRRQYPFQSRILDFYCFEKKLGIELDGPVHLGKERKQYDQEREKCLSEFDIRVIRFSNERILSDIEEVLEIIKKHISPLPSGEGLGVREDAGEGLGAREGTGEGPGVREAGGLHLGCIARLSPEKGIDVLLQAIQPVPEFSLTIVGKGPEEGYVRRLISEDTERMGTSLPRIRLIPFVNDLDSFYASIDALVLPSVDHDPFGLVAAEAMMRGVPVVVTDACGIASCLQDKIDALIVKAGDAGELQQAMESLADLPLRERLSENGKRTAEQEFSLEKMIGRYEQLLQEETGG